MEREREREREKERGGGTQLTNIIRSQILFDNLFVRKLK